MYKLCSVSHTMTKSLQGFKIYVDNRVIPNSPVVKIRGLTGKTFNCFQSLNKNDKNTINLVFDLFLLLSLWYISLNFSHKHYLS